MTDQLADGCYLHLPFPEYIKQKGRLGSTDKGRLWLQGPGWWWASANNPYAKRDAQSPEQLFGECAHAALLEGMHAYETRFVVEPNKADYPDALFTEKQIKAKLQDEGVHLKGTGDYRKEDWAEAAEIYLPDAVVWDNVLADFHRRQTIMDNGAEVRRRSISAEADYAIRAMHEIATEDTPENAEMRELLSVGSEFPILAEVSILYSDEDGLQHRARFDKMLPLASIDLKTAAGWNGRPLVHSVDDLIKKNAYDVQLSDYQIARQRAFDMVLADESCLHGGTEEERLHFIAMAHFAKENRFGYAWIFYQKPDASGRAPILFPVREAWGGPYHRAGYRKRHEALALYRRCMERFGPDRPWGRIEPVHYTREDVEPHITQSHWGWGPEQAVPGEAEYFGDGAT